MMRVVWRVSCVRAALRPSSEIEKSKVQGAASSLMPMLMPRFKF